MESVGHSEMLVRFHQMAWGHTVEGSSLHIVPVRSVRVTEHKGISRPEGGHCGAHILVIC
jgi:hypothetical protein